MNKLITLLFFGCAFLSPFAYAADGPFFFTEHYPPLNFQNPLNGKIEGFSVEILRQMLQDLGETDENRIKLDTWENSYNKALIPQSNTCVFSTLRLPTRETLFQWIGPLTTLELAIWGLKKNQHRYHIESASDIYRYRYAVIADDAGETTLKKFGVLGKRIKRQTNIDHMLAQVYHRDLHFFVHSSVVINWHLKHSIKFNPDEFQPFFSLTRSDAFIACNTHIDKAIIAKYQKSFDKITSDAVFLERLEDKYHLTLPQQLSAASGR